MIEYDLFPVLLTIVASMIVGIAAYVWAFKLVTPDDLFDWFPIVIEMFFHPGKYNKIHKLLYACEGCVAGQMAFWSYLAGALFFETYHCIQHFIFIICSIFFATLLPKLIRK